METRPRGLSIQACLRMKHFQCRRYESRMADYTLKGKAGHLAPVNDNSLHWVRASFYFIDPPVGITQPPQPSAHQPGASPPWLTSCPPSSLQANPSFCSRFLATRRNQEMAIKTEAFNSTDEDGGCKVSVARWRRRQVLWWKLFHITWYLQQTFQRQSILTVVVSFSSSVSSITICHTREKILYHFLGSF